MFLSNPSMQHWSTRPIPNAIDPVSFQQSAAYMYRIYGPPADTGAAIGNVLAGAGGGAIVGSGIAGGLVRGRVLTAGASFAGGVAGMAVGAGVAAGLTIATDFTRYLVPYGLEMQRQMLNEFWRRSPMYLQTPRGTRSQLASTMRQQMMMTIHNSAYTTQAALGNEAKVLHR